MLTGCSTVQSVVKQIPSFSDPNQSASIVRVKQLAMNIDCDQPQLPQAKALQNEIQYFILYSESAGIRHHDVIEMVSPLKDTVDDWVTRSKGTEGSKVYCNIKKGIIQADATKAAKTVLGRF